MLSDVCEDFGCCIAHCAVLFEIECGGAPLILDELFHRVVEECRDMADRAVDVPDCDDVSVGELFNIVSECCRINCEGRCWQMIFDVPPCLTHGVLDCVGICFCLLREFVRFSSVYG